MTADLYYETARKLVLKDGREVFVRQLNAGDAEAMLIYLQKTAQETHFLMRLPEEAVYTLENERKILQNTRESKQTLMLGALTQDGSVVGNVGVFPIGERFKVRHRASLGIAVVQEYWNTGLGTVLLIWRARLAMNRWSSAYFQTTAVQFIYIRSWDFGRLAGCPMPSSSRTEAMRTKL